MFSDAEIVSDLNSDAYIENTQIVEGKSQCNLILKPNVHIEIAGVFQGKIIGQGNNIIRIKGEIDGIIMCNKAIFLEGGKMEGDIYMNQLQGPENQFIFNGSAKRLPIPFLGDKINFEYVVGLK